MPTPASGTISMDDMRTNINRATGSAIGMDEMRARYGGSGAISFSDLYDAEGFTISPARYFESSKFFSANNDGWSHDGYGGDMGTISPEESNGCVQFAAASFLIHVYEDNIFDPGNTGLGIRPNTDVGDFSDTAGNTITAGYKGGDITRIVIANTSYSIISSANTFAVVSYNMPTSGTLHCLVKF
jgi:hypothetical protein